MRAGGGKKRLGQSKILLAGVPNYDGKMGAARECQHIESKSSSGSDAINSISACPIYGPSV